MKVGLRSEVTLCLSKINVGVNQIAVWFRCIWPPSLVGDATKCKFFVSIVLISAIWR